MSGIIGIILVLLLAGGLAAAGYCFFRIALLPRPGPVRMSEESAQAFGQASVWSDGEWLQTNGKPVSIQSRDGKTLRGYRVENSGHRYAVVVHGYTADAISMAGFAHLFFDRGFTVLAPDLRGHGESEGNFIGMGWPDRLDMLAWIDTIVRQDAGAQIILHGVSMGGATVMMTAGEPLPKQVKLAIEDCGYTSVWDEFTVQMKAQYGLPPFPILNILSAWNKIKAGFWLSEADAVKQVKKSQIPILFIHGEEDTFVPFWMLDVLYGAATCEKERLAVPGAGHGLAAADSAVYWGAVDGFLEKYGKAE